MKTTISKQLSLLKSYADAGQIRLAKEKLKELSQLELGNAAKAFLQKIIEVYNLPGISADEALVAELPSESTISDIDDLPVMEGISIVSCCMNRNDNLKKAVETWVKLDVDEIVIVDWSSSKHVMETISSINDDRIKVIRVEGEEKWILTYGFNVGLRFARYSKIYKFDADIQVTPDFFERNYFDIGEYCRGSWKFANEDQKFVNGSFGAFKKDLKEIGYYNEFIRTYGYDDSDIYKRLTNLGLNQRFISSDSILHLEQKEELRLANQTVASHQFLDCYNATELHNLINKNISQLYDYWFPNNLQDYDIQYNDNGFWESKRISEDAFIPHYVYSDAISYAVIQLLTWKYNEWVWLGCDVKFLAHFFYLDYERKVSFDKTKSILGLDESLQVIFIGNLDFLTCIDHLPKILDSGRYILVSSVENKSIQIKTLETNFDIIGYSEADYQKIKEIRSYLAKEIHEISAHNSSFNNRRLFATSVYDEKVPHRMQEYLECFERNAAEFDILVLFYEEQNGAFFKGATELLHKFREEGKQAAQVYFLNISHRPTFKTIFNSIDTDFPGVTAFVSNADIAFDDSIKLVKKDDLDDVFLVLSRREVVPEVHTDDGLIMNQFGVPNTFSADVWIYKAPLKHPFKADFPIGSFHCDSFMNFYLGKSGYRLYNPCLSVNCFHIHDPVFNSSEEKERVLRESIQKKLDEEIVACGGEFPLRGVQWCRISDITNPELADMTLLWSDMIVNITIKEDGSNIFVVLLQALMALRVNARVQAGHTVNINMPHSLCHSNYADLIVNFRLFVDNPHLTFGVLNDHKDELFAKDLPDYQKVTVDTETLIHSYKSSILEIAGPIYGSKTEYYFKEGLFGVLHTPALLCQISSSTLNDLDIYCLIKSLCAEDRLFLLDFLKQSVDTGFVVLTPFFHEMSVTFKDEPDFEIMHSIKSKESIPLKKAEITFLTSIYKGDEFLEGFLENIAPSLLESNGIVKLVNANSPGNEKAILQEFLLKYPGLSSRFDYIELDKDPGLYNCWRLAIEESKSEYVGNANLDDRRSPFQARVLINTLKNKSSFQGAATAIRANSAKNLAWFTCTENQYWFTYGYNEKITFNDLHTLTKENIVISQNIMHCMPIWRKSLHAQYGYFDEERYGTSADWAFWLKCSKEGEVFYLEPGVFSYYYLNEHSHNRVNDPNGIKENKIIEDYLNKQQSSFVQQ